MREIMGRLKLTVNEEKTRICPVPEETFDFSGVHVRADAIKQTTGKAYMGMRPSKKSIRRMIENVHALTAEAMTWQEPQSWWTS